MSYSSEVLADSPLAHWRLGDASGSTMTDSSGNSRNGTYTGSPTLGQTSLLPGDADTSVEFNGSTQFATITDAAWMEVTSLTIEFWAETDDAGVVHVAMSRYPSTAGSRVFQIQQTAGAKWSGIIRHTGGADVAATGATTIIANAVYHVVLTAGSGVVNLYVNGVLDGTNTYPNVLNSGVAADMLIGGIGSSSSFRWDGHIDEVAFYGSVLSAARVLAHYNAGMGHVSVALNRASETDSARALTAVVGTSQALSRATESDLARALTPQVGVTQSLGRATETDAARPLTVIEGFSAALGKASETGAARPLTPIVNDLIALGRATETDVAQPVTFAGGTAIALGRATETDAARPLTATLGIPLGRATSTEIARPFARLATTVRDNRVGGLVLGGFGIATWNPPVVEPPEGLLLVHKRDVAQAFSEPTIVVARPVYDVATISQPAPRIRITVDGKDVSYFRDVSTPIPSYALMEPFVYGAGTLEFPQICPAFEQIGVGATAWVRKEAPVRVQILDPDTGAVLADAYRGFVESWDVRGDSLTVALSGELTGRLEMADRQPPIFREVQDVGRWVYFLHSRLGGVKFAPFGGPVTGIKLPARGGSSMLNYGLELLGLAVHENGDRWTVGRRANGTYGMWLKDTETIHATIYLDDKRMVGDLHSTLGEEPNRIYATGTSPAGERIKFGVYPGMVRTEPAVYPYANTATTFGIGTTALDTDYPALGLIEVMIWRLVNMGYLSFTDATGGYDADVASAIKRLQADAGLSRTGIMNYNTWRALYDVTKTGYSIANSRIEPAAQQDYVRPWNYTASGAESSKNPAYRADRIKVDRSINTGSDFTRQQMARFAAGELREAATKNWAGTITCHLAAIEGEHNFGDPLTDDMLMPLWQITPGMNVWVPNFDGGTLFHVSGKEVPAQGGAPVLAVDTRARDTMALWEVITRNRESRSNPARIWLNQNRSSQVTKDAFVEFDEIGGVLDAQVSLSADTWNVFPVIAGQAGTIARIHLEMTNPCRFAVMVFAKSIGAGRLNRLVGDLLTEGGQTKFGREVVRRRLEDRGFIEAWGTPDDACGYGYGSQPEGSAVNGKFDDQGSWGYHTFAEPVLYIAVRPRENTKVRPGRILWNQLDAGA